MDDELAIESGLDALIALLDERGIEHYECVASECEATVYEDKAGNAHECWEGGESGIVNVVIAVTPEDALSVDDLNGVIRENAKLREQLESLQPTDYEGNALDIADTVHMLRSEWDGDHEWDDVVVELALTRWGGDRWIVRGSRGEAWACDCLRIGYDEDAYEGSDDAEPIVNPTLIEAENAKLRELVHDFALLTDGAVSHWGTELEAGNSIEAPPAEWKECLYEFEMLVNCMSELGIEV